MKLSIEEFLIKRKETRPSYVFDLRPMEEFGEAHLMGAHNLPFEHLESNLHRLPFAGDLLLYDGGEGVAKQAGDILNENGFGDFFYVEEGYATLQETLANSDYDIRLFCTTDDPKDVKMEVIQNLLDFEINPMVAAHGGVFTLVDIKNNDVTVELGGGCQGCGMVDVTLRQGVETRMREVFPDLGALIDNTEHASGDNPYFQGAK